MTSVYYEYKLTDADICFMDNYTSQNTDYFSEES